MPPIQGKPLILYVSATDTSLGAFLAQQDENKKRESYILYQYNIGVLWNELHYNRESMFGIIFALEKLRHYMLAHSIKLVAKIDLLKYLLNKETLTGRLAKWVMVLTEFDIEYVEL